ncbi:hypothetical protein [Streptomyces asiaticus]|uniref:hypothetical protein n=1 Tax=Streptomyces asiaticus TaxID=114695 RepID=UPI003D747F2A
MTTSNLPWTPSNTEDIEPLPVGKPWDAISAPTPVANRALELLGDRSGAVVQDDTYGKISEHATEETNDPFADEAWRTAVEHAAGCPSCRTPGAKCETGEGLLRAYEEATRQARSGRAFSTDAQAPASRR